MNHQLTGFLCSLFIHTAALYGVLIFAALYNDHIEKPPVIDLSILEGVKNLPPGPSGTLGIAKVPESALPQPLPVTPQPKCEKRIKPNPVKKAQSVKKKVVPPDVVPAQALQMQPSVPVAAMPILPQPPSFGADTTEAPQGPNHDVVSGTGGAGSSGSGTGGGGGDGGDAISPQSRYLAQHFAYIKDLIQQHLDYPRRAVQMGWEGKVVVSFVIQENGISKDVKIVESSGFSVLDDNVVRAIHAVEPFPRPPMKAEVQVPIMYRLN
ncbi:MAG TPA: energy transducer TonB [Thermodesulfobacteriota bacterium]|nr:energy transducer TonB [Thermodesulfobacteriota bacterium]